MSWTKRKGEQLHLITIGASTYSSDSRYSIEFKPPNDWQLQIKYVNERDEGQFECQVNTVPSLALVVLLEVIGKYYLFFTQNEDIFKGFCVSTYSYIIKMIPIFYDTKYI